MYGALRHLEAIAWKRRPIQLTFFVTRRCTLRCPFCFYLRSADPPPAAAPELSLAEVERISRSLGSLLWVAFSGGEVFLRDDLAEISRAFYENTRPAVMLYPTNGDLPALIRDRTEEIAAHCRKSVIAVKLSLDGIGPAHDALRGRSGSFERVMETCRLLAPLLPRYPNLELGINTVMCSDNQDEMDAVMDFARGLPAVSTHTVSLARGRLLEPRYTQVDARAYARVSQRLAAELGRGGPGLYRFAGARLKAAQDILQRRLIHRTLLARRRLTRCYAGRLNLVLTETGEVYPCELAVEGLGNVREHGYDMRRLLGSERARRVRASIGTGRCHCTHECYAMTNILFNPRWYPALAREYLRLLAPAARPGRAVPAGADRTCPAGPIARRDFALPWRRPPGRGGS